MCIRDIRGTLTDGMGGIGGVEGTLTDGIGGIGGVGGH